MGRLMEFLHPGRCLLYTSFPCAVKSVPLVCDSLIILETDRRVQVFLMGGPEFLFHKPNEFIRNGGGAAVPVVPGDLVDRAADCHRCSV